MNGGAGGIAVIGMSGRFPGAASVAELWAKLRAGESGISRLSDEELLAAGVSEAELRDPRYVKAAGVLGGAEMFDAGMFGLTPREAEVMDPQLRVFLECAWEALEDAGHDPERFGGWIGVYAGAAVGRYLWMNVARHPEALAAVGSFQAMISNDKDYLATQASYRLNLRGPSIGVQTACSTSLVAVHLACQALLCFECDMALAGGVSVSIPERQGYLYQEDGLASPDGCCRTFDARAAGTIRSNGAGIVVLRRLSDALESGDRVLAVIRGSAINNDGSSKVGFTAPSVSGQAEVIAAAQAVAGVEPETISYVEAHGTATSLGDPIEVAALTQAFGLSGRPGTCALGSIKSNLGHLDAAAGVAGLIKTALALWHGELPPSLHYEAPNPRIDFASGPFYVNAALRPWPAGATPRRAGVSAFGIGGTNVHVVLEEAPRPAVSVALAVSATSAADRPRPAADAQEPPSAAAPAPVAPRPDTGEPRPWQLLVLSARSEAALRASAARLAEHLAGDPGGGPALDQEEAGGGRGDDAPSPGARFTAATEPGSRPALADVAYTLQTGRRALEWRWAAPARGREEARERLREAAQDAPVTESLRQRPEVAFVLPDLTAPQPGLGAGLYAAQPVFRQAADECFALLEPALGAEVRRFLGSRPAGEDSRAGAPPPAGPADPSGPGSPGGPPSADDWRLALPAHFVRGYALARLWMSWGIEPQALLGHGAGEDLAACLAGVLPLAAALQLSVLRGRLAALSREPASTAGAQPIREQLRQVVQDARPQAPQIPLVSGLTGRWAEWEDLVQPAAWVRPATAGPAGRDAAPGLDAAPSLDAATGLNSRAVAAGANDADAVNDADDANDANAAGDLNAADDPNAAGDAAGLAGAAGLACLLEEPARVLLEVGPRSGLARAAAAAAPPAAAGATAAPRAAAGLRPAGQAPAGPDEMADLITALGDLWRAGVAVRWDAVHGGRRPRRTGLPTYPFERRRYYLDPVGDMPGSGLRESAPSAGLSATGGRLPLRDWFHLPSWKRSLPPVVPFAPPAPSPLPAPSPIDESLPAAPRQEELGPGAEAPPAGRRCLIFADGHGLAAALGQALAGRGWQIAEVTAGAEWRVHGPGRYQIRPGDGDDHARLWQQLADGARLPHRVLHLWNVTAEPPPAAAAPFAPAAADAPPAAAPSAPAAAEPPPAAVLPAPAGADLPLGAAPAAAGPALAAALDRSFYSLLHLAQNLGRHAPALTAQAPARDGSAEAVEVVVFSNRLHAIDAGDRPEPAKAALLGPCRVLPQEQDHVRCRSVDLDLDLPAGEAAAPGTAGIPAWLVERCLAELHQTGEDPGSGRSRESQAGDEAGPPPAGEPVVAWRGANRWLPSWEPLPLAAVPATARDAARLGLHQGGVYLITGGLGGVGLEVARLLAERARARLVLCGRSPFPAREGWDAWLAAQGPDEATSRRIRRLRELEDLGAEVLAVAGDVADRASMAAVREAILARFGALHGIFHAAGVAGGGLLQARTPTQAAAVLAPKVAGTAVLAEVFGAADGTGSAAGAEPGLMVLFSSINALTGGIGQADYSAANAFQDSFAQAAAARRGGPRVVSVNWDAWQEVGMAAQTGVPEELRALRDQQLADAIRADEGRDALARILAAGPAQVAVATDGLDHRLAAAAVLRLSAALAQGAAAAPRGAPHPRPAVAPAYVPPAAPDEALLAGLWQELLGIAPIGRDDGFFELGGHSLLAAQLITRIREQLGADLPLRAIFAFPTPALLAQALRDGAAAAPPTFEPSLAPLPRESRRLAPPAAAQPIAPAAPAVSGSDVLHVAGAAGAAGAAEAIAPAALAGALPGPGPRERSEP